MSRYLREVLESTKIGRQFVIFIMRILRYKNHPFLFFLINFYCEYISLSMKIS